MLGIILVTHGRMANDLIDAAKMIYGQPEDKHWPLIESIVLEEGESPEALLDDLGEKIGRMKQLRAKGVIILVDLFGSSTANAGTRTMLADSRKEKTFQIAVVSGVNLPMLIELIPALNTSVSVNELAKLAVDTGRKGIINLADELAKRKKKQQR